MPDIDNLKEKIYFGSWFQRLHCLVSWFCCFWAMRRQSIRAEGHGGAVLLIS
jgi:hypothetical protein